MDRWSNELSLFYQDLQCPPLPAGYACMNPYLNPATMDWVQQFLAVFYADAAPRQLILGINPGRLGSGITGIGFTDPVQLAGALGIANGMGMRAEPSSTFIYEVIQAYGGVHSFYARFLISAVSPLGYLFKDKNVNYYEIPSWRQSILPHIIREMEHQLTMNVGRHTCFCIGQGENFKVLVELNDHYGWFERVVALPHPRWVMQYKRKTKHQYIDQYLQAFSS